MSASEVRTAALEAFGGPTDHTAPLLAVVGVETADPTAFDDRELPAWLKAMLLPDDVVGDGKAPAWGFLFGAVGGGMMMEEGHDDMLLSGGGGDGHSHAGGDAKLVVVDADGNILFNEAPPGDFPVIAAQPLGKNWTADSTTVTAAADQDFQGLVSSAGAYVFASLAERTGTIPAWIFEAGTATTSEAETASVDARDGLPVRLGNRDPIAVTPTEKGNITGTASTSGGKAATFTITSPGHKQLEFFLGNEGGGGGLTQTGAQMDFVAKGPNGESFPFHWDGSGGTNQVWFQFDAPTAGEWTLEAQVATDTPSTEPQAGPQQFSMTWCALGATRC